TGSPQPGSATGTSYSDLAAGAYTVSESGGPAGYTASFSGDCDQTGAVTLTAGDAKTCTITNTFTPPPAPSLNGDQTISRAPRHPRRLHPPPTGRPPDRDRLPAARLAPRPQLQRPPRRRLPRQRERRPRRLHRQLQRRLRPDRRRHPHRRRRQDLHHHQHLHAAAGTQPQRGPNHLPRPPPPPTPPPSPHRPPPRS